MASKFTSVELEGVRRVTLTASEVKLKVTMTNANRITQSAKPRQKIGLKPFVICHHARAILSSDATTTTTTTAAGAIPVGQEAYLHESGKHYVNIDGDLVADASVVREIEEKTSLNDTEVEMAPLQPSLNRRQAASTQDAPSVMPPDPLSLWSTWRVMLYPKGVEAEGTNNTTTSFAVAVELRGSKFSTCGGPSALSGVEAATAEGGLSVKVPILCTSQDVPVRDQAAPLRAAVAPPQVSLEAVPQGVGKVSLSVSSSRVVVTPPVSSEGASGDDPVPVAMPVPAKKIPARSGVASASIDESIGEGAVTVPHVLSTEDAYQLPEDTLILHLKLMIDETRLVPATMAAKSLITGLLTTSWLSGGGLFSGTTAATKPAVTAAGDDTSSPVEPAGTATDPADAPPADDPSTVEDPLLSLSPREAWEALFRLIGVTTAAPPATTPGSAISTFSSPVPGRWRFETDREGASEDSKFSTSASVVGLFVPVASSGAPVVGGAKSTGSGQETTANGTSSTTAAVGTTDDASTNGGMPPTTSNSNNPTASLLPAYQRDALDSAMVWLYICDAVAALEPLFVCNITTNFFTLIQPCGLLEDLAANIIRDATSRGFFDRTVMTSSDEAEKEKERTRLQEQVLESIQVDFGLLKSWIGIVTGSIDGTYEEDPPEELVQQAALQFPRLFRTQRALVPGSVRSVATLWSRYLTVIGCCALVGPHLKILRGWLAALLTPSATSTRSSSDFAGPLENLLSLISVVVFDVDHVRLGMPEEAPAANDEKHGGKISANGALQPGKDVVQEAMLEKHLSMLQYLYRHTFTALDSQTPPGKRDDKDATARRLLAWAMESEAAASSSVDPDQKLVSPLLASSQGGQGNHHNGEAYLSLSSDFYTNDAVKPKVFLQAAKLWEKASHQQEECYLKKAEKLLPFWTAAAPVWRKSLWEWCLSEQHSISGACGSTAAEGSFGGTGGDATVAADGTMMSSPSGAARTDMKQGGDSPCPDPPAGYHVGGNSAARVRLWSEPSARRSESVAHKNAECAKEVATRLGAIAEQLEQMQLLAEFLNDVETSAASEEH